MTKLYNDSQAKFSKLSILKKEHEEKQKKLQTFRPQLNKKSQYLTKDRKTKLYEKKSQSPRKGFETPDYPDF